MEENIAPIMAALPDPDLGQAESVELTPADSIPPTVIPPVTHRHCPAARPHLLAFYHWPDRFYRQLRCASCDLVSIEKIVR